MKHISILLAFLVLCAMPGQAMSANGKLARAEANSHRMIASAERELAKAVSEAKAAIDAAERTADGTQSLDQLNAAAREQVIRELKLSGQQRREFEALYTAYRAALDKAIAPVADTPAANEAAQRQNLKAKLANIAATAQIKRDYVDKFAEILSADQIRQLYNTEGAIGTSIKQAAAERMPLLSRLRGSGRLVTQDWGTAENYQEIVAGLYCKVTVSPVARTISVTADDNVIDYIEKKNEKGTLSFRFAANARSIENIHIEITVPMSTTLRAITTGTYGKVTFTAPVKTPSMKVTVGTYGAVAAEIDSPGEVSVSASSYGSFKGPVRCGVADYRISSYGKSEGAIVCRDSCRMQLSSYARFSDAVQAPRIALAINSYAKFNGSVTADRAKISVSTYGEFSGGFSARSLTASADNYSSISLKGSAKVADATVSVAVYASFSAPELQVTNYDLQAGAYSKVDIWCSGNLKINASSKARVSYAGPCTVQALSENIRRRQ